MDYRFVEEHKERVERALHMRRSDFDLNTIEELGQKRRELQQVQDAKRSDLKQLSSELGKLFKDKNTPPEMLEAKKEESASLKKAIQQTEEVFSNISTELSEKLLLLPNILHESVVDGASEKDNPEIRKWGEPTPLDFKPKGHDEIGPALGLLDFERAARVSGARFTYLKGWGARLERALLNFMMDLHAKAGYVEMWPPVLLHREAMRGTGQLPKFAEEAFVTQDPEFFLAPTAEVPIVNYHREEILKESDLPISYVAYSPCFRREAGSYGKDTKGLIRQHQFDKVELVKFSHPDRSYEDLEQLTHQAEEVLKQLELPYRVISLCSGDIGFASSKTYDLEVWLPGQNTYREISSCSNCEEFQARRAGIRFKPSTGGKPRFVHTLNGSGLAIGRTLIAVLENGQQKDGSIQLPKALAPYLGNELTIPAA